MNRRVFVLCFRRGIVLLIVKDWTLVLLRDRLIVHIEHLVLKVVKFHNDLQYFASFSVGKERKEKNGVIPSFVL